MLRVSRYTLRNSMENAYIVKGGNKLQGEVKVSGAKNVALKTIIAALMFDGEVILKNIPKINDVVELLHLITIMGGKTEFIEENTLKIDGSGIQGNKVDLLHGSKIRVSFLFFAPLLHKFGTCYVPNPGGCRLGARPIDRIVNGMKNLGIVVEYDSNTGYYEAKMKNPPHGSYEFVKSSHTGTELLVMLAVLGKEEIVIKNAALEPEIDDLIQFFNEGGAQIVRNESTIVIKSVKNLKQKNPYTILSDRIEAVTFATAALATKGKVTVYGHGLTEKLLTPFLDYLTQIGARVTKDGENKFTFEYIKPFKPVNIETTPYPGFLTDWQPLWAVLMTQADGEAVIHERLFENRFSYVKELHRLGAKIEFLDVDVKDPQNFYFFNYDPVKKQQQAIKIKGPQKLHNGVLTMADLRAGASLITAALVAEGESVIYGAENVDRGYERLVEKITSLGGSIKKV